MKMRSRRANDEMGASSNALTVLMLPAYVGNRYIVCVERYLPSRNSGLSSDLPLVSRGSAGFDGPLFVDFQAADFLFD